MTKIKAVNRTLLAILTAGILSLPLTLLSPSEAETAYWHNLSKSRLMVLAIQVLVILFVSLLLLIGSRKKYSTPLLSRLAQLLNNSANYTLIRNILFGISLFLTFAFIYFSVFVPQALSAFSGWLVFSTWMIFALFVKQVAAPADFRPVRFAELFPSWKGLTKNQKITALVLLGIGLIYFCLFIPLNLRDSESLKALSTDEIVMYPVVVKMLSAQPNLHMALYRFFVYGDYIYGFPFYGFSALLLLPVKLIFGSTFGDQIQLNMLLMRQLANVLPGILASFLFVWLATKFKKFWPSLILFLLLLTLPEMFRLNYTAWHPDEINLFFVALTLFYLDRDQLRFGPNFFIAAIACGFSVATRLFGVFFFLAIAWLLFEGLRRKVLTPKKAVILGLLFIGVMAGSTLVSNPYSFCPGELGVAKNMFAHRQSVLAEGISGPDPEGIYRTGIQAWWPFMTRNFGSGVTLGFLALSALIGVVGTQRKDFHRILFAWLVVIGTYMIGFVVVKSPWYLLPFLVPLYCAALAIPESLSVLPEKSKLQPSQSRLIRSGSWLLAGGIGIFQLILNFQNILNLLIR
jgi:hypothetical protein